MITIRVGVEPEQQTFAAHASFLSSRSRFFRTALSGDKWLEGRSRTVDLPEDIPRIFEMYLSYVYTGNIDTGRDELNEPSDMEADAYKTSMQREYADLFQIYVLGEKLLDDSVKDASISAVFKRAEGRYNGCRCSPSAQHLAPVYEGTPIGSPCRRLLIGYLASFAAAKLEIMFVEDLDNIPKEALVDLTLALRHQAPANWYIPRYIGLPGYMQASQETASGELLRFTRLPLHTSMVEPNASPSF